MFFAGNGGTISLPNSVAVWSVTVLSGAYYLNGSTISLASTQTTIDVESGPGR